MARLLPWFYLDQGGGNAGFRSAMCELEKDIGRCWYKLVIKSTSPSDQADKSSSPLNDCLETVSSDPVFSQVKPLIV